MQNTPNAGGAGGVDTRPPSNNQSLFEGHSQCPNSPVRFTFHGNNKEDSSPKGTKTCQNNSQKTVKSQMWQSTLLIPGAEARLWQIQ